MKYSYALLEAVKGMSVEEIEHYLNVGLPFDQYCDLPGGKLGAKVRKLIRARDAKSGLSNDRNALKTAVIDLQKLVQQANNYYTMVTPVVEVKDLQIIIDELVAYLEK